MRRLVACEATLVRCSVSKGRRSRRCRVPCPAPHGNRLELGTDHPVPICESALRGQGAGRVGLRYQMLINNVSARLCSTAKGAAARTAAVELVKASDRSDLCLAKAKVALPSNISS